MGAVAHKLSKFFVQNEPLRHVSKGLQLSKFSEILNSNAKPDKLSNHLLKITFQRLNSVRKSFLNCLKLNKHRILKIEV